MQLQGIRNKDFKEEIDYEDPAKVNEEDENLSDNDPLSGKKGNELSTRANQILEEEYKREKIIEALKNQIASGI